MIARAKRTTPALTPAACYIRMSSDKQDRSPAQQRAEIAKLASREGCFIGPGLEYIDEGITGDSGPDQRPGFRAMLDAAAAGRFKVLLAWHQNRIGRFDSLDAGRWLSPLRESGVRLVTCAQGYIDLSTFAGRLAFTVQQEANQQFLIEHSAKTLRGKLTTARAGGRNGGVVAYGMDRGLFDAAGTLVRRLAPGEAVRLAGHIVRALPSTDEARVSAVRFLFGRYASAAVSFRALAGELATRGFPPPPSGEWNGAVVAGILRNPLYCGVARFGACATAKYHCVRGGEIVAANGSKGKRRAKPQEEWILTPAAHQGIIPAALFKRVQARLPSGPKTERRPKAVYPLSGLVYCGHCGRTMTGQSEEGRVRYVCTSYLRQGRQNATGCGKHVIDAARIQAWLIGALRDYYLGPGRAELVAEIRRQLKSVAKGSKVDAKRLEKRAAELEREVARLVKAIRTTDAGELVEALDTARRERQGVQEALRHAARGRDGQSIEQEAESVADELGGLEEGLAGTDPALIREVFRRLVDRIECQWEPVPNGGQGNRQSYRLTGGVVYLRDPLLVITCARYAEA